MERFIGLTLIAMLAACDDGPADPRGIGRDETLLSVSASGQADTRPDEARFDAGVNTLAASAAAASEANNRAMSKVLAALGAFGIPEKDLQTRAVTISRIDYGRDAGRYQASNIVTVRVRDIDRAGAAVAAASEAGANLVNGPELRLSNPEKAANSAYASAYKAARERAGVYADAAGLKIVRVVTIRDGGGSGGPHPYAQAVAPPPVVNMSTEQARILPGMATSAVNVQVDFALRPK